LDELVFKTRTLGAGVCGLAPALDEFLQTFVTGRTGKLSDVGSDIIGGRLIVAWLWRFGNLSAFITP
jgi:VanZ family protein